MITILTEYAHVSLKQIEIKILENAIQSFTEKYKKRQNHYDLIPTHEGYIAFKYDITLLSEYLKSYRFSNIQLPTHKSWGDEIQCRFREYDIQIIIDLLEHHKTNPSLMDKPSNEIENPMMFRIFKHHVIDLLEDMKVIKNAMGSKRLRGIDHA